MCKKVTCMVISIIMIIGMISCVYASEDVSSPEKLSFKTEIIEGVDKDAQVITPGAIILHGEVGDITKGSNGIVCEIVGKDQTDDISISSSKSAWSIGLRGTSRTNSFTLSENYKYWKVWFQNTQSPSYETIVTIEDSYGNQIGDPLYVSGGATAILYSDQDSSFPEGRYYVNFTSGKAEMSGSAACRLATTFDELDI